MIHRMIYQSDSNPKHDEIVLVLKFNKFWNYINEKEQKNVLILYFFSFLMIFFYNQIKN
jgi:hypothetical protein